MVARVGAAALQSGLRIWIHRAFGKDPGERPGSDRSYRFVECAGVGSSPLEGDLPVQAQRPGYHPLGEELGRDQEPCHPPPPLARDEREGDAVQHRDVVDGDDRRPADRNALGSGHPHREQQPAHGPDDDEAEPPPSVQVAAMRHARMLPGTPSARS